MKQLREGDIKQEEHLIQCTAHNKNPMMVRLDENIYDKERYLCSLCIRELKQINTNIVGIQQIQEQYQKKVDPLKLILENQIENIDKIFLIIKQTKQQLFDQIEIIFKETKSLKQQIANKQKVYLDQNIQAKINFLFFNHQIQKENTYTLQDIYKQQVQKIRKLIESLFEILQGNFNKLKSENQIISQQSKVNDSKITIKDNNSKFIQLPAFADYTFQHKYKCFAFAFNKENKILAAGAQKLIKLINIEKPSMPSFEMLKGHIDDVTCLVFSQKQNILFSSGCNLDKTIRIWIKTQEEWKNVVTSNQLGHKKSITGLILNKNEDELITSSLDCSIKIWKISYKQIQLNLLYTIESQNEIKQIKLNNQENTLLSIDNERNIKIWKKKDYKWKQNQKIIIDNVQIQQIYFVKDQIFVCKLENSNIFKFFQENLNQQFNECQNFINLNNKMFLFPIIKEMNQHVLLEKPQKNYHVIHGKNNQLLFLTDQNTNKNYFASQMSDDGKMCCVWKQNSESITLFQML